MTKKKISILGSTGSIGRSTLEVVRQFPERFEVVALGAGSNAALLRDQILEFSPRLVSVMDAPVASSLQNLLGGQVSCYPEILYGSDGFCKVAAFPESDMLVSAMVGAAGLLPTLFAIEAGKNIALANKETLVAAGQIVIDAAAREKRENSSRGQRTQRYFSSLAGKPQRSSRTGAPHSLRRPFFQ